jgi:hypothetical protein
VLSVLFGYVKQLRAAHCVYFAFSARCYVIAKHNDVAMEFFPNVIKVKCRKLLNLAMKGNYTMMHKNLPLSTFQ